MYRYYKELLKGEGRNVRYFNRDFWDLFISARVIGDYSAIFETDFYNKNGGTYCRLLELYRG